MCPIYPGAVCVGVLVAWFPGSEEVSKLPLPADKGGCTQVVPSSPGCELLGQRTDIFSLSLELFDMICYSLIQFGKIFIFSA